MKIRCFHTDKLIKTAAILLTTAVLASTLTSDKATSHPAPDDTVETASGTHAVFRSRLSLDHAAVISEDGSYITGGIASRLDYVLDEKQITYAAAKFETIISDYLTGSQIYLAVVPDKNYFLTVPALFPQLDYGRLIGLTRSGVPDAVYIDLFGMLSARDYYRTDAHWDQQFLLPVAQTLCDAMGLGVSLTPDGGFTMHEFSRFYGLYSRRYSLPLLPDTLRWLTSATTDAARMTGAGFAGELPVYTTDKLTGTDPYDMFVGGPQSVLTIISPNAKTDRELIIFRDSFGSSLAPLLLEGYVKITLVDLRYIPAALLSDYIDFHGQDVLFLYSTTQLGSGMLLK